MDYISDAQASGSATVIKINFKGNRRVDSRDIKATLYSRVDEPLNPVKIRKDISAIYNLGLFKDVQVDLQESTDGVILTFIVSEKPAIRKVLVTGYDDLDLDDIKKVVNIKPFDILNESTIKQNVRKIRDLYIEKGFFLADITSKLYPRKHNQVDILFVIREYRKVIVKRISFLGNKILSAKHLRSKMKTEEGGYFSWLDSSGVYKKEIFQNDLHLVSSEYFNRGYVNMKISPPLISLSRDKRYMEITLAITEGKQFSFGNFGFKGDLLIAKNKANDPKAIASRQKEYLSILGVKSGKIFNRGKLGQGIMRLNTMYFDKGYAFSVISPKTTLNPKDRSVSITFDIQKGKRVYIERIEIRGNNKTRDKVIRRELKFTEQDLYSLTNIKLSRMRIFQLGFFQNVEISQKRGSAPNMIIITFKVEERPTGTFQIGAGFSSVENFIFTAQIAQNNLLGRGQSLSLMAQLSSLRQLFRIHFYDRRFFDSHWIFSTSFFNEERDYFDFTRRSYGGSFLLGYPLHDNAYFSASYKIEDVNVSMGGSHRAPSDVPMSTLFNDGLTSSIKLALVWDTRNNRLFPSRGFFNSYSFEVADKIMGSDNVFMRHLIYSRWYFPIGLGIVFKTNAEFGLVTSRLDTGVPIFERFFVGGINSVRGFAPRSLGPRIKVADQYDPAATLQDFNIGGNKMLVFNFEIEFPIFQKAGIRGVIFFDAGNAFNENETLNPANLRTSIGWGFRWFSPIGPLRFEWGAPLKPRAGEEPIVFEFTIGNFF